MALEGFTEGIKNVNTESIYSIFNSGILSKVYFFLKIAFWMILVLFGIGVIYKFYIQYKLRLTIHKRVGENAVETFEDKGKIVTDEQNKRKIVLFKTRKGNKSACTLPLPEARFCGKRGKFDHYNLWLDDNYELHPIEPPKADSSFQYLKIRPQERAAWERMESEILYKKHQKKDVLLKYATPAILMTACITAFLIFFFASKEIGTGLQSLASSFQQVASSCTKLG